MQYLPFNFFSEPIKIHGIVVVAVDVIVLLL